MLRTGSLPRAIRRSVKHDSALRARRAYLDALDRSQRLLDDDKREAWKSAGRAIREGRTANGMTLRKTAKYLGISAAHLCDIEHGRRNPNAVLGRLLDV